MFTRRSITKQPARRSPFSFLYVDRALIVSLSFFSVSLLPFNTFRMATTLSSHLFAASSLSLFPCTCIHSLAGLHSLSLTFSLIRKLQHPLFHSLSLSVSISYTSLSVEPPRRSPDHSLLLALSITLLRPSFPCNLPQCVTSSRATESHRGARARPCLLDFGGVSLSNGTHSYRCTPRY